VGGRQRKDKIKENKMDDQDNLIIRFFQKIFNSQRMPEFLPRRSAPQGEKEIIWLVDPGKYFFVREQIFYSNRRNDRPKYFGSGVLLGWSILNKDQGKDPFGFYVRRFFYLTSKDLNPNCVYLKYDCHPGEGVTPNTIEPGKWGEHLQPHDHAWGRKNG
jgi:hypothetical protein